MNNIWILAQNEVAETPSAISSEPVTTEQMTTTTAVASDPNAPATRPKTSPPATTWIFMGLMFLVMYFLLFRGPKKKQKQHQNMVKSLKKNDKVRTIGGIIGTIVDVRDDEITLKVDESSNTKIKIASSAIGVNLSQKPES